MVCIVCIYTTLPSVCKFNESFPSNTTFYKLDVGRTPKNFQLKFVKKILNRQDYLIMSFSEFE